MKISVVIPTYNRAYRLAAAVDSVLDQTLPAHEVIVVDDGSTDDTRQLLQQRYPQITCISQPNHGVSHARNTAIRAASGDWIALLDSDDCWQPQKLERQAEALKNSSGYSLCHGDEIWIRNGRRVNPMKKHAKYGGYIYLQCLPRCVISPSAAIIRRSVLDETGLFDETLPACEDYDLWLRLCATRPVLYLDEKLIIKYGGHDDQLSARHWGMDRFRIIALEKMLAGATLSAEYYAATQDTLTDKLTIVAQGADRRGNTELAASCREKLEYYRQDSHRKTAP